MDLKRLVIKVFVLSFKVSIIYQLVQFPIKSSKGMVSIILCTIHVNLKAYIQLCLDQFELRIPYASLLPDIDDSSEPRREMSDPAEVINNHCRVNIQ